MRSGAPGSATQQGDLPHGRRQLETGRLFCYVSVVILRPLHYRRPGPDQKLHDVIQSASTGTGKSKQPKVTFRQSPILSI